jgi:hypothetical protein
VAHPDTRHNDKEVNTVASESEYLSAIARARAGSASQRDYELCTQAAKLAGSLGNKARDALRNAGR